MNLTQLPDSVLLHILSFVPHSDLFEICYTLEEEITYRLSTLSKDPSLWRKIVLTRPLNRIRLKKLVPLLHSKTKEILITGSLRGPSISEYFLESLRRRCQNLESLCFVDVVLDVHTSFFRTLSIKSLIKLHLIRVKIINLPFIRSNYSSPFRNFSKIFPLIQELKLVEASWLHESDMIHIKKSKNIQLIIEVHNKNVQKKTKRIKFAR
nr:uncharacterized protein LOC121123352 [Lepeophtheirus salmonis]XP_040574401.1 uncharacterized protein LOC121123352 [Lepeophtheirus salmonis]XP_040574402.1 uncharacterized protein LOC121123352 [Lepeophtheirus salmonis]